MKQYIRHSMYKLINLAQYSKIVPNIIEFSLGLT